MTNGSKLENALNTLKLLEEDEYRFGLKISKTVIKLTEEYQKRERLYKSVSALVEALLINELEKRGIDVFEVLEKAQDGQTKR